MLVIPENFVAFVSCLFAVSAVGCYSNSGRTEMEQQINLRFLVKLRNPIECFKFFQGGFFELQKCF